RIRLPSALLGGFRRRWRQARQGGRLGHLAVTQGPQHFQHLAPCRERPAIVALVLVHRPHEDDFLVVIVPLARGRIDLAAAFALLPAIFTAAPLHGNGDTALTAVVPATVAATPVGDENLGKHGFVAATHGCLPCCLRGGKSRGNGYVVEERLPPP